MKTIVTKTFAASSKLLGEDSRASLTDLEYDPTFTAKTEIKHSRECRQLSLLFRKTFHRKLSYSE